MAERAVMKGNEALAEAALRAGCRFYSGYPITPQTEILEYLSSRMWEVGGQVVQTEDELTGLHVALGAGACGAKVLSSSAGPGFALFHEGISYLSGTEIPAVLINVQRVGSACGGISVSQGDYEEITHGGGNGDSYCMVLTPGSVQENVDMVVEAFELANKYRQPVIILSDAIMGQMMEDVNLPEMSDEAYYGSDWVITDRPSADDPWSNTVSNRGYKVGFQAHADYQREKWAKIDAEEQKWESVEVADADVVCVAYGISSRVCKEAVKVARAEGIKLGLIRLKTAVPFPVKAFEEVKEDCKGFLAVDMSVKAQMVPDIKLATKCNYPVYAYATVQDVPDTDIVLENVKAILAGTAKEVK